MSGVTFHLKSVPLIQAGSHRFVDKGDGKRDEMESTMRPQKKECFLLYHNMFVI